MMPIQTVTTVSEAIRSMTYRQAMVRGTCLASGLGTHRTAWRMKGRAQLREAPFNVLYFSGGPFKREQRSGWFT